MNRRSLLLLLLQLALVLTVAGKFVYDRATRPRLWVRAAPYDPETPLRGRYLSLQLQLDACEIPANEQAEPTSVGRDRLIFAHGQLVERKGQLVAAPVPLGQDGQGVQWRPAQGCAQAALEQPVLLFIPEHAVLSPASGHQLWVEVTLPHHGAPRPIRLAISDASGFHPVDSR